MIFKNILPFEKKWWIFENKCYVLFFGRQWIFSVLLYWEASVDCNLLQCEHGVWSYNWASAK